MLMLDVFISSFRRTRTWVYAVERRTSAWKHEVEQRSSSCRGFQSRGRNR